MWIAGTLLMCHALVCGTAAAAAEPVGETVFARGAMSAQTGEASARLLGTGEPVYRDDVITTAKKSFGVVKLKDGTRMALRPETTLRIDQFEVEERKEKGVFSLFRGGFRAITGFISKRRPDAMAVETQVATIGIRGTKFDARLCASGECAADAPPEVAGRVGRLRGRAGAWGADLPRPLQPGAPLFEGDEIATGACAELVVFMADRSRVRLGPRTRFRLASKRRQVLTAGRFEIVTGASPAALSTPVGLVTAHGTHYAAHCGKDGCALEVRSGSIDLNGRHIVQAGERVDAFPDDGRRARAVRSWRQAGVLRLAQGGGPGAQGSAPPGLYVACYEGACSVSNPGGTIGLTAGQAAFTGVTGTPPANLPGIPEFQSQDPYFPAVEPEFEGTLELFDDTGGEGPVDCIVQ